MVEPAEHPAPGIEVVGLTKRFGAVTALRDVTLRVAPGEVLALLGPNGGGKSTLLRILATTVLPDDGRAVVGGHDVAQQPAACRRTVGLVLSDERSWYWRLTGRQNLAFFAAIGGMSRRHVTARVDGLLAEVQLDQAADRRFDGYSSGMRARLSLARAMLHDPAVLLLDEPTHSLDPGATRDFVDRIERLVRDRGTTGLMVTHDLHLVARLAHRAAIMTTGTLVRDDVPADDADALEAAYLAAVGNG